MKTTQSLFESPLMRAAAPWTLAGYQRFRQVIDVDGALPASIKALYIAVAAAAKNWSALSVRELARGAALGLTLSEAMAGCIVLSSARGEGAALAFLDSLMAVYPSESLPDAPPPSMTVAKGEAEDNFKQYFGVVPAPLTTLLQTSPLGADAYYLMRKGTIECNPLNRKLAELMLLTILSADYSPIVAAHIKGARTAGAKDAEIVEAVLCAIPAAGMAAWISTAGHLEAAG